MNSRDKALGMGCPISRRNFINGAAVAVGATMVPGSVLGQEQMKGLKTKGPDESYLPPLLEAGILQSDPRYYPPVQMNMRGNHPGSFEGAHALRDGNALVMAEDTAEYYDLIVVGAGMSGLAAAYSHRKRVGKNTRILILDNHDDFGGHAKRNEFTEGGQTLMATGGTSFLVRPTTNYTAEGLEMMRDIGVDLDDPTHVQGRGEALKKYNMDAGTYFNSEAYGTDKLVTGGSLAAPTQEFLDKTPLKPEVKADLLRLCNDKTDYLAGKTPDEKRAYLEHISYHDYLLKDAKVHPEVPLLCGAVWALNQKAASAFFAFYENKPGFVGIGIEKPFNTAEDPKTKDFTFPAGNSDVGRLIVRSLIPESLPAGKQGDVQLKRVDYTRLDRPNQSVRIRLNSTAVKVTHIGEASHGSFRPLQHDDRKVEVTYSYNGKLYKVRGGGCVLACNNAIIPYLVPELPEVQKKALHMAVRCVNMITTIQIKNFKAMEKMGISGVTCPAMFYQKMSLSGGIQLGEYKPKFEADKPILFSLGGYDSGVLGNDPMTEALCGAPMKSGMSVRDQMRVLRYGMYSTPFATFERHIREQMGRVFGPGGFDPKNDIMAIAVNRWPHGFALGTNSLWDPACADDETPFVVGRKQFGRIAIANSDASGADLTQTAFDQAFRAVDELITRDTGYTNRI